MPALVELVELAEEAITPPKRTMASPTKSRAPHKAVYAYQAQEPDELTLSVGDEVHVQQRQEDGWWFKKFTSHTAEGATRVDMGRLLQDGFKCLNEMLSSVSTLIAVVIPPFASEAAVLLASEGA